MIKYITIFNETKTMKQWSEDKRCVVLYKTLRCRMQDGWDAYDAITKPTKHKLFIRKT